MRKLDGNCFVVEQGELESFVRGSWEEALVIGSQTGAVAMSQWRVTVHGKPSPVRCFGDSDTVLFVLSGQGFIEIGPRRFPLAPECGVYVRPGETFRIVPVESDLQMLVTVCPQCNSASWPDQLSDDFDDDHPERVVGVDEEKREQTGNRFFQLLVDQGVGSKQITQFIGIIPKSKAPSHHHLYEEAITVLSGHGRMWTGEASTPVGPGSMIYLPIKQAHCLECQSDEGMQLIGHFYPAGSPAVSY